MAVAVLGWAQTEHRARMPDVAPSELVYETVAAALAHAGVAIDEVDFVIGAGDDCLDGRSISSVFVAEAEGAFLREESKVEEDGAFALAYAWMKIAAGAGNVGLVVGYSKPSESARDSYSALCADPFFQRPLGIDAVTAAALGADAYRRKYGVGPEPSADLAVRNLAAASRNPYAMRWATLTTKKVLEADRVAGPLGAWELPATADGACAVVLAAEERARRSRRPLVAITGLGWATDGAYLGSRALHDLASAREAARRAYRMAGVLDPRDWFDVAETSPASADHELMLYEALGFAAPGEGSRYAGRTVMNPSGGTLGADPIMATGLVRVAEAAGQLAGEAEDRQVAGARRALAHGACGLGMQSNVVFCLEARGEAGVEGT